MAAPNLTGLSQEEQFKQAAAFAGVPVSVLQGIWRTESSEGKAMRSPAGARGHFGLMPATQATWEQREGRKFNPDDFGDAVTMAALTLKENLAATKGNISDALRMYNGGTDRSRWDNPETRAYAGKVLGGNYEAPAFEVRNPGATPLTTEEVWNTSAFALRNGERKLTSGASPAKHLSDIEKGVQNANGIAAAVAAVLTDRDPAARALDARVGTHTKVQVDQAIGRAAQIGAQDFDNEAAWEAGLEQERLAQQEQSRIDAISWGDKMGAAFDNNTLTAALWHILEQQTESYRVKPAADPNYNPFDAATQDEIFGWAQNEDELEAQFEATSQAGLVQIRRDIERERANTQVIADGSSMWGQTGYNLLAGVVDPVGWAAGLGVGKVFQLVGAGSRAAIAAGNVGRGLAFAAGEGAAGNVLVTAALDVAGSNQTTNDYAFAAGTGMLFGATFGTFDWLTSNGNTAANQRLQAHAQSVRGAAVDQDSRLLAEAQANLGPNATPQAISAELDRLQLARQETVMRAVLGSAADTEQILPRVSPEDMANFKAQYKGAATTLPKNLPGAIVTSPKQRTAIISKYGLDKTIADDAERLLAAEMYGRAERFLAENPIDKAALQTFLANDALGLESTATRMLNSDNPLMQFAASVMLENSQGAAGRRTTAAITAKLRERVYIGNTMREYDTVYKNWRNERRGGHGVVNDMRDILDKGRERAEFDKAVYLERERRFQKQQSMREVDARVSRAADMLDAAYERMRVDQKHIGTLGSDRLSDEAIKGYTPRRWSAATLRGMDAPRFAAFTAEIERQFKLLTKDVDGVVEARFDDAFAKRFAREYATRTRRMATGSYDIPANLHDTDAADMIRDALKAMKATDIESTKVLERFSRGGASFTKGRLDMDLTASYTGGDGKQYTLLDSIDTDNIALLRNYARRTAGETALAKYGIMGEPGLKELRLAIEAGIGNSSEGARTLEAFDQVAAEFLGRPFGTNLGLYADNARILTSAIRLGGMGFTQLGETANAIGALGVKAAYQQIKGMPKMFKEVRAMANGKRSNGLLESIELYTGDLGMDGYKMTGLYDINDNGIELYGKEALGVFSRAVRASNHGVRILSGHRTVAAIQTRGMAEQIVLKALRYVKDGGNDAALRDMGITDRLAADLKKDLKNIAKFKDGRVVELDLTKAENITAANEFAQAVARGAAQIIQDTFIGETGKWAHNDWLKLLTQFRTFSLISAEKQWGRQAKVHGGAKATAILLGAMGVALPIHLARIGARSLGMEESKREEFLERELDPIRLSRATLNYVSVSGVLPDLLDVTGTLTGFGSSGARSGVAQDFIGGQIAPAAGLANDVWKAAQAGGRVGQRALAGKPLNAGREAHAMAKLVPGANIPYFAWAVNSLQHLD